MQHQILEGPLNCLSVNRECSQVVVAGRNVFKVFSIEEDAFVEKCNLRVGKNLNLNYSASDVMWNPVEDHLLASAATNGAVVVWNLNKSSRSKQETVFLEHKRTVHKVCFHGNEPQLLMSGAQDGLMMLFDLRQKEVASVFNGRSECVRDVQFSPHQYFVFGSAFENGNIQLWDMRNPQRAERQFTAHNGPAFSIDWHPHERYWLGTAGRDKLIKVWDTQNINPVRSIYSVQTIASVARIKWRPQRQFHIASCALLVDFAINVWDVRRPYIPFASFNEHLDVVTGIVWKQNDPHIFLSSSRDSTLYQHVFRDATRPADNANPVSVDISTAGNVAHASCDKLAATPSGKSAFKIPQIPIFRQRPPDRTEQFTTVSSTLCEFETESLNEELSLDWFVESALGYRLSGRPIGELCEHNARVAHSLKRLQVAQTWNMLKLLYTTTPSAPANATPNSIVTLGGKTPDIKENNPDRNKLTVGSKQHHDSKSSKIIDQDIIDAHGDISTGVSEEDSDVQDNDIHLDSNLSHIASGMGNDNHSDFFFGDGDVDQTSFEYDNIESMQNGADWELPCEAFQLRHEIGEQGTLPDPLAQKAQDSPSSANESDYVIVEKVNRNVEKNIREDILAIKPFINTINSVDFVDVVVDMLKQYAERGDIQMAVTSLIVLDDKIRPHIDDATQEQWFTSYIDLLGRFKLWTIATAVIKLSKLPAVSDLNQRSTRIQTNCSKCMKPLQRTGWLCDKCKSVNICSICHLPVKGIYVWCQGCSHGGHLQHIQEWLLQWKQCPAGCGHLCEYIQNDIQPTSSVTSIKSRSSYPQLSRWT